MSIPPILHALEEQKCLTNAQLNMLREHQNNKKEFLSSLVSIFENKVYSYLKICQGSVKSAEKTMECALSFFLNNEKYCTLPLLWMMLKNTAPDLLISSGLKTESVFSGYIARHRLLRMVPFQELQALIQEVENEESLVFPPYLLNAYIIESQIATSIKTSPHANALSDEVNKDPANAYQSLVEMIFFLGKLTASENQIGVIQGLGEGYIQALQNSSEATRIESICKEILFSKEGNICYPAFSLMGIPVKVDTTPWTTQVNQIKTSIQKLSDDTANYALTIENAKKEANQQIDAWRNRIPQREVVWGLRYGVNF